MSELSQLSPQPLWDIFAKICSIPHPSYHEEQLAEHIMGWAKEKGLHAERDQVGNILIRKGATAGMENRKPVVLQAHLDMVPQKNNDTVHDFTKDPIQPYIDGEWVKARGTTLGADNGIGMASALAVLADDSVAHGPLEVLLTMTEEAGMDGAFGLQANWLQADILINTDSEEEGEIYMGCAGGIDFTSNLALTREAIPAGFQSFKLTLKGLKGGHSGGEIHVGPAGTGKTYLAVAAAVDALERQEIRRILLTRPAVEAGEKLGFLPGDLSQKVDPYLRPLYDALFEMLGFEKVEKLIERNVIEVAPLAYMRGRTLNDAFIILDESQNTTIEQMKMFLTRIGFNSKAVITGDVTQIDLPRNTKSGLRHAVEVLAEVDEISFNFFHSEDVVRHPVVARIVNAYEAWEEAEQKRKAELAAERKREAQEQEQK